MKSRLSGFSIIEFLIAMAIGTFLIATVGSVYLSNKSTYLIQDALSRLQENGRFANYYLTLQLRMAGYQGCSSQDQVTVTNLIQNVSNVLDYDQPVRGYEGGGSSFSPALPANIRSKKPVATSDVIEISMASSIGSQVSSNMASSSAAIPVYTLAGAASGVPVMITNCAVADIFMATSGTSPTLLTHASTLNTQDTLSIAYSQGAKVMRFAYYAFYVKDTGRVNSQNQPVFALVRLDMNGTEDEIAEGVEKFQVSYGVDTDADNTADTYQSATQVNSANNWNNVISIQINLLLATNENVNDRSSNYRFNGSTFTSTDGKLRKEWTTFVNIRNRGLPS